MVSRLTAFAIENACKTWVTPFEVAKTIFGVFDNRQLNDVERQLKAARSLKRVAYDKDTNTYCVNPEAKREALANG